MISIGVQTKNIVDDHDPAEGYKLLKAVGFSCTDFSLNSYLTNTSLYKFERNDFFDRPIAELEQYFEPHKAGAKAAGITIHPPSSPRTSNFPRLYAAVSITISPNAGSSNRSRT